MPILTDSAEVCRAGSGGVVPEPAAVPVPLLRRLQFLLVASFFSTTGPCVSAVGGGGASPMRFE